MRTERDVRDAYSAMVSRAPRPDRSRVVVPQSGQPIRRHRMIAGVAVATATAALAVPAGLSVVRADGPIQPASNPTPPGPITSAHERVGKQIATLPMRMTPHAPTSPHLPKKKVPRWVTANHHPPTTRASGDLFRVDLPAGWRQVASSHNSVSQSLELNAPGGIGCVAKVYVRGGWDPAELPATATPVDVHGKPGYWVDTLLSAGVVDGVVAWRYAPDAWGVTSCGSRGAPSNSDPYGRDRLLEQTLARAIVIPR
jgi:hypothetical protein